MTILIANPTVRPALSFNRIHLKSFVFLQSESGAIKVELVVRYYAVDPQTQEAVFSDGEHTVIIDDFNRWLLPVMAEQLGSPEAVAQAYVAAKSAANDLNLIQVMAAFQAGIARICAAQGLIELDVVE